MRQDPSEPHDRNRARASAMAATGLGGYGRGPTVPGLVYGLEDGLICGPGVGTSGGGSDGS